MRRAQLLSAFILASFVAPCVAQEHAELFQSYGRKTEPLHHLRGAGKPLGARPVERVGFADQLFPGEQLGDGIYEETPSKRRAAEELHAFIPNPVMIKARGGGTSGKPLGVYRDGMKPIEFRSKTYYLLPTKIKAHWAIYLYSVVESLHGGWQSTLHSRYKDPVAATYVDYPKVDLAAVMFFRNHQDDYHDPQGKYARLPGVEAAQFRSDAILDAVNMIGTISYSAAQDDNERRAIETWANRTLDMYNRQVGEEGHAEALNPAWKPPTVNWNQPPRTNRAENPYEDSGGKYRPASPFAPPTNPSTPSLTTPSTSPRNVPQNPFEQPSGK